MASNINVWDLSKQWNSLSWEDQQAKLKANSKLQWALNELWLTVKSQPTTVNQNIAKTQWNNYPANNTSISSYSTSWSNQASSNASVGTWAVAGMNNTPTVNYSSNYPTEWYKTEDPKYTQYKTEDPRYSGYKTEDPRYSNWYMSVNPKYANANQNQPTQPTNKGTTTVKSSSTNRATVTPQQQQWDYQDNSQARMDQIADNLDKYTITNPDLFKDYDSFYNFFIAGKGRSEDQIRFLDQYYADYKKNEKYKNLTPEQIGSGIANGSIPEDYISTVAATDPNKAEAIRTALNDSQDTIRNESYLSTLAEENWFEKWNREVMGYRDENKDWVDDWLYVAPTAEEQRDVDRINEIDARVMEIDNAIKNTYEDLRDRYPWAAQSTLMAMANDRNKNLQRERDDLMVEKTKLQWTVKYQQEERSMQITARKDTISELQKNYGIYMEYSPEWIKERTQAEYEATHITLDQADSWTETDKKMALQWVLDGYYEKYWDIIQRSEQQVINDVIATAKKEWISLSDALEKNFLKPLRSKPDFQKLSTLQSTPNVVRIWTDADWNPIYWIYDENTWTFKSPIWDLYWDAGTWSNGMYNFSDYTPMSSSELESKLNSFESDHPVNSKWGQCWAFVNDYLQSLGLWRLYTDPIDKKLAVTNSDTPVVWGIAVMSSEKYPQYWHTAIIKDIKEVQDGKTMVQLLESNRWDDEKVHTRWVSTDKILWVFDPTKQTNKNNASSVAYDPNMTGAYNQFLNDSVVSRQKDLAKQYGKTYDQFRAEAEAYAEDRDANAMKPIVDAIDYILSLDSLPSTWDRAIASWEWSWAKYYKAVVDPSIAKWASKHNLIYNTVWMDKFLWLKSKGATFWALSDSEREAIYRAATDLDPTLWEEDYREALSNLREQIVANSHWMLNWYWASAQARQANYIADSLYWDLF